jgi:enterochelin esterase-like enzyme
MIRTWLVAALLVGAMVSAWAQNDEPNVQVVPSPAANVLLERLASNASGVWRDGDALTFAFKGTVKGKVFLCCGLQLEVPLVQDGLWAVMARIKDLDRAVLSYNFVSMDNQYRELTVRQTWRGPLAPAAPPMATTLRGKVQAETIQSKFLLEKRGVSVYLPPNFDAKLEHRVIVMADGQSVDSFAKMLEPLFESGKVPPVVIVGLNSSNAPGEDNGRYAEYVKTGSSAFKAHESFVVDEALPFVEQKYGLTKDPAKRATFGFSNGADWAVRALVRLPKLWRHAIVFSPFNPFSLDGIGADSRLYFEAGTLETPALRTAPPMQRQARSAGVQVVYSERVAGHDDVIWLEEFPAAVTHLFGR